MAILTISREFGSGAKAVGEGVAGATGYDYIDRRRMFEDLEKQGPAFREWTKELKEHYPDSWGAHDWFSRGFVALFQSLVLDYAKKDRVILSGTGAGFILKGTPHALHVRIGAPMESRILRVQGDDVVSRETAEWFVEKADEETARAIYSLYGRDWSDPSEYDMVFDASLRSTAQIVSDIVEALREREKHNTDKSRKALELRALAARIKAVIAIDSTYDVTTLDVEPKEEGLPEYGIAVKGIVREEADIEEIKKTVTTLAGGVPIEFHLVYRWYPRLGPWQFK